MTKWQHGQGVASSRARRVQDEFGPKPKPPKKSPQDEEVVSKSEDAEEPIKTKNEENRLK